MKINVKVAKLLLLAFLCELSTLAVAQTFNGFQIFGDSNTDDGRSHYIPEGPGIPLAVRGVLTTPGGTMWADALGAKYGLNISTSAIGGTNYASAGAVVSYTDPATPGIWSATDQVSAYLSSVNRKADPNSLYTVYIGINDLKPNTTAPHGNIVSPQNLPALSQLAQQTTGLVQSLSNAGARYIVVPNVLVAPETAATFAASGWSGSGSSWGAFYQTWADSVHYYNQSVWNGIASQGINFIPADLTSVFSYVLLNPARFGITETSIMNPACPIWVGNCTAAIMAAFSSANAGQTHYFSDSPFVGIGGAGHPSAAVQQIEADYVYGLLVAPSQVSMIANQANINQIMMNDSYLNQVGFSFRGNAPKTMGAWVLGNAQQVNISGSPTSSNSTPYNGSAGIDFQINENVLLGGFAGYGQSTVNYSTNASGGNFTQSGTTFGLYSGYRDKSIWLNGVLGYTWLSNNVNRVTPAGITSFSNASTVNGYNTTIALQTGYDFELGKFTHGPLIGYSSVKTAINGFTESGNYNSLQFANQNINAQVGSAGYQVNAKFGEWLPFAKAAYNSQLANMDRNITTTLTTISAPSYTMPAIAYGTNWTNLTIGLGYQIDPKTVIRASYTQQISQQNVSSYNTAINLTSHF